MSTNGHDVIIIGAGAAGLMCAIVAAQRGRSVLVIEHANRVGKKILMSGGGRCNFTNIHSTPENFLSANPHFCKSALARYTPQDFLALVERHKIAWHEKELGQLFCDVSSKLIVRMLLDECALAGVRIETGCAISDVRALEPGFELTTSHGRQRGAALVVATGGLSIPSMGASGFGHDLAVQFGHALLPTRAGLVPFTLSGKHKQHYAELAGVALPVSAQCNGQAFSNAMLFTHRGVSGPALLQISSYWQAGDDLRLDLLPDRDASQWLLDQRVRNPARELKTVLSEAMPKRLAQRLCDLWLPNRPLRQFESGTLRDIGARLQSWPLVASGTEGYRTAEVTLGGVDTNAVSSSTMQSRKVPGLYFIGEVLDVTGHLGGHNFQWAWASGQAAGQAV